MVGGTSVMGVESDEGWYMDDECWM